MTTRACSSLVCALWGLAACGGGLGDGVGGGSKDGGTGSDGGRADSAAQDGPSSPSCGDGGDASVVGFGPQDTDFSTKAMPWTYQGGASYGTGEAGKNHAILPDLSSSISQTFSMPQSTAWCGNGLSLDVAAASPCGNAGLLFDWGLGAYSGVSDVCLGDWGYGDATGKTSLVISVAPSRGEVRCSTSDVDQVSLADTLACARPGQVLNGTFAEPVGWSATGTAEVAPHAGTGGTPAAHLWTKNKCDSGSLSGFFSVPYASHLPNAALSLTVSGTAGSTLTLSGAALVPLASVITTGAGPQTVHACLVSFLRGQYSTLTFGLQASDGDCLVADPHDVVVDEVGLVSDPACSGPEDIIDGDFESTAQAGAWSLASLAAGAIVAIETGHSHSGASALHMTSSKLCAFGTASAVVTVHASTGAGAGPALKFWYDIPALGSAMFGVQEQSRGAGPFSLPATTGWKQATLCLPPGRIDTADSVIVRVESSGSCGGPDSGDGWFDDFTITTDPSCPSK